MPIEFPTDLNNMAGAVVINSDDESYHVPVVIYGPDGVTPLWTSSNPGVSKISDGTDTLAVNSDGSINAVVSGVSTAAKQDDAKEVLDAVSTATGSTSDTEVTGNGSVIAILKRLRTLIGDSLATLGSAIGTKATLIAGSDGTNARAIKTNAAGEQLMVLTGSNLPLVESAAVIGKVDINNVVVSLSTTNPGSIAAGASGVILARGIYRYKKLKIMYRCLHTVPKELFIRYYSHGSFVAKEVSISTTTGAVIFGTVEPEMDDFDIYVKNNHSASQSSGEQHANKILGGLFY